MPLVRDNCQPALLSNDPPVVVNVTLEREGICRWLVREHLSNGRVRPRLFDGDATARDKAIAFLRDRKYRANLPID